MLAMQRVNRVRAVFNQWSQSKDPGPEIEKATLLGVLKYQHRAFRHPQNLISYGAEKQSR